MKNRNLFLIFLLSINLLSARAEEGLWIPMLLQHYNINIMQKEGLRLTAEDIYSVNKACLKDAIVIFGGGCTGELISEDGLLLTNHHCGFSAIQSHSSVDKDYLTNGFWAMNREEELPNSGLKVTFLIRIEDVTSEVLESAKSLNNETLRDSVILSNINKLKDEVSSTSPYKAVIKPFYYGNEYYMFVYQEYTDVRLVGAPPSAVGNYGEDLDNWVWPRHTGDFSVFRIYAGKDNMPANYSPDNKPYKSKKHLTISTAGIREGDFTMVMGYPGTTNEYIISDEISFMLNTSLPKKIAVREARLKILDKYMKQNDTTRIMYASKYRAISNSWKKWEGVIVGLENTNALSKKRATEDLFQKWTQETPARYNEYGGILPGLRDLNSALSGFSLVYDYSGETVLAAEIVDFAVDCNSFVATSSTLTKEQKVKAVEGFKNRVEGFYKDFKPEVDREIFAAMLKFYYNDIDSRFRPEFFKTIEKKYKGDFNEFAGATFKNSLFTHKNELLALLDQFPQTNFNISKRIMNDPVFKVFREFSDIYSKQVIPYYDEIRLNMQVLYRTYMKGLREMQSDKVFYPDANFTMRVAYGKVEGYKPADAVEYLYSTNLSGVIEKYRSDSVVYWLPSRLVTLYNNKDFGPWADKSGEVPVCFAASNHTSGGNSGSPVLNAEGQLIGLNFDRNWEGTMSDIYYDASICRNIAVDIRYVLFIIDRYAGSGYLIDEMDIAGAK